MKSLKSHDGTTNVFALGTVIGRLLLKNHDSVAECAISIPSSHCSKRLEESQPISTLRDCKGPKSRLLDQ